MKRGFLRNYTSEVSAAQSIFRIEQVLLQCGVSGIMKEYALNRKVSAITFRIEGPKGPLTIRLPADEEAALMALWLDYLDGDPYTDDRADHPSLKRKHKDEFRVQAERTAWRIVKDWVEVQMSMIELKQADVIQVFLPYIYDGKVTYYQALKESNYAGLLTR